MTFLFTSDIFITVNSTQQGRVLTTGSDFMDLTSRKIKILEAIITDYINTGEPVGSRTISKKYPLGISSATIRNEMSDLEDMGLICQPHTSAGRIPSNKGYRLYVDRLMGQGYVSEEESLFLRELITSNISRIDYLMEQTAKALASLTNYATVVTEAKSEDDSLKRISLVPIDSRSVVMVKVSKEKKVENTVLRARKIPDFDTLNNITAAVNAYINTYGTELNLNAAEKTAAAFGEYNELMGKVFSAISNSETKNSEVYLSGVNNILDYPEFSDVGKAKDLFRIMEQKDMLRNILKNDSAEEGVVQIIIGGESNLSQLKDLSIIKTNYKLGGNIGFIGIIGPTRMNYPQTVSVLKSMIDNLNDVLKAITGG